MPSAWNTAEVHGIYLLAKGSLVKIRYRGYDIEYNPPPIADRNHDWQFSHQDYNGGSDNLDQRCGTAPSLEVAKREIDEQLESEGVSN